MHGRLRGPISQLPLPPAKGYLLPVLLLDYGAKKIIMEKGRNDTVKRPNAQILTVVSTPLELSPSQLQSKMTLSLPILKN